MSEIDNEELISLTEAAGLTWLPRRRQGRKPSVSWFYRMVAQGCHAEIPAELREPQTPEQVAVMKKAGLMTQEKIAERRTKRIAWIAANTVRLECRRVAGTLCTSEGSIRRFIAASSGDTRTPGKKKPNVVTQHREAEKHLQAEGILV